MELRCHFCRDSSLMWIFLKTSSEEVEDLTHHSKKKKLISFHFFVPPWPFFYFWKKKGKSYDRRKGGEPHTLIYFSPEEGVACMLLSGVEGRVGGKPKPTSHPPLIYFGGFGFHPTYKGGRVGEMKANTHLKSSSAEL